MNLKRFLIPLLVMCGLAAVIGAEIPGTVVLNKITLGNDAITNKSIGDTGEMKGTPKSVATIALRDAIPAARREQGMECWVIDVAKMYRLVGGILNANWVEVVASSSTSVPVGGESAVFGQNQLVSRQNRYLLSNALYMVQFTFTNGPASNTVAYAPNNTVFANAIFSRDVMPSVEAWPDFFTSNQLRQWARAFTNTIGSGGSGNLVGQHVYIDGSAPLFTTWDAQCDFVWLVYEHYRKTRVPTLFVEMQPRIDLMLAAIATSNNLVLITPGIHTGWGFNDGITNKGGLDMVTSMFRLRTYRHMAEMAFAAGQTAAGSNYLAEIPRIKASAMTNLWDASRGLFRSYTVHPTNHSVVGSALALNYDAVDAGTRAIILAELVSGLPGGEDYAANRGYYNRGGIRFWPMDETPVFTSGAGANSTNHQGGGYWPEFCQVIARAIQPQFPDLANQIVAPLITNTIPLLGGGNQRAGQLEWWAYPGQETGLQVDAWWGAEAYLASQSGGVIAPISTGVYDGYHEGEFEGKFNGTVGPGGYESTLNPLGGLKFNNGTGTSPSLKFLNGDRSHYGLDAWLGFLRFGHSVDETNGTVLGTLDNLGNLVLSGTVSLEGATLNDFETRIAVVDPTSDHTATLQNASGTIAYLTDITGGTPGGSDGQLQYNNGGVFGGSSTVSFEDDATPLLINTGQTRIGAGGWLHQTTLPALIMNNGGTETPSIQWYQGDTDNFGDDVSSLHRRWTYKLHETGGTVLMTLDANGLLETFGANSGVLTRGGGTFAFEGVTENDFETTLTAVDPTADRTVTFQNASGTVAYLTDITAQTLDGLSDVTITTPAAGHAIGYNGTIWTNGPAGAGGGTPGGSDGHVQYNNGGVFGGEAGLFWDDTNDRLGIGTASPGYKLQISPDGPYTAIDTGVGLSIYNPLVTSGNLAFGYNGSTANVIQSRDGLASTFSLAINPFGGNVGIGETVPASKLSVSGNASIGAGYDTTAAPANGLIVEGNVGIGKNNPAYALDIAGTVSINTGSLKLNSGNIDGVNQFSFNNGTYFLQNDPVDFAISWYSGSPTVRTLTISDNNRIGIGVSTPSEKLDVNGNVRAVGYFEGYFATGTGFTLTATNAVVNVTGASQTMTLPTAVGITGRKYTLKASHATGLTVATTSAQTIDGTTPVALTVGQTRTYISDGANWFIDSDAAVAGAGGGDVTAAAVFANDNRIIRSDGTGRGVQASAVTLDDSGNFAGLGTLSIAGSINFTATGSPVLEIDAGGLQVWNERPGLVFQAIGSGSGETLVQSDNASASISLVNAGTITAVGPITVDALNADTLAISSVSAEVGGVLKTDTTTTGNVGGGEDNLISYTVGTVLGANGDLLEFDVWGTCAANANPKQIRIYFGAALLLDTTAVVLNGNDWRGHGKIVRTGAATQTATCEFTVGGTLLSAVNGTITDTTAPTETLSGSIVFKVTGASTVAPADNDIVQNGMVVKWYPSP